MNTTKWARRVRTQRGSITVWMATFTLAILVMIGLAVDGGGKIRAQQRAQDIAAQAARTAGQQLQPDLAISGVSATLDTARARRAAQTYLNATGVTGTVTIRAGQEISVEVVDHYEPVFLGMIGIGQITVTASATSQLNRVLEGQRR